MPTQSGPNTKGQKNLIFAYDTADTQNSYKGEPTTNLINNGDFAEGLAGWSYSNYADETHIAKPTIMSEEGFNFVRLEWERITGTSPEWYYIRKAFSQNIPDTHTWSCKCRIIEDTGTNSQIRASNMNNDYRFAVGWYLTGKELNKWHDVEFSRLLVDPYTRNETEYPMEGHFEIFTGTMYEDMRVVLDIAFVQVERKSHATPFVNGTRSVTEGILDITENNNIDLSNADFDSNSNLIFDGSTNYLRVNDATLLNNMGSGNFTISLWLRRENIAPTGNGETLFQNTDLNNGFNICMSSTSVRFEIRNAINDDYTSFYFPTEFSINTWLNIVVIKNGAYLYVYNQGKYIGKESIPLDISTTVGYADIGHLTWYSAGAWKGDISSVNAYDRALSTVEVKQNYNALKSRYNL